MIELYYFNNSVCSQKVKIVLAAKGQEWQGHHVDLFRSEQYDPEYLKLNPKGYVPTLVHDGRVVRESTLICEYLDEVFPDPPMSPADPVEHAAMRLWGKAVDEGLHPGVTMISFSAMFRDRMKAMSEDERLRRYRNVGDPARRDRFMSTYEYGVESPYVFQAIAAYETAFGDVEAALADGRDWLAGGVFGLAEANLAPYCARLEYLTLLDVWTADRPAVGAWWDRVKAHPAYRAGIPDPLSEAEVTEMRDAGARLRDRVAALRDDYLAW